MIDNKTRLNMVIGYPLEHTQSPLLHNTIYSLLNCNAVMLAHSNQNLASIIQAAKVLSVGLIAVTMPFKEAILQYLDSMSQEVQKLKSANTVICRDGQFFGYNTDIDGVEYALRHHSLLNKNILVIGAGGASRAAAYYLQKNHANIFWLNRTPERLLPLVEIFGGNIVDIKELNHLPIDGIINTTPVGMFPDVNHCSLSDYPFRPDQVVFDMVYNPVNTMLLQKAILQGATVISGRDMFIGQGIKQIELWLDQSIAISQQSIWACLEQNLKLQAMP